jgi:hypothetical protein
MDERTRANAEIVDRQFKSMGLIPERLDDRSAGDWPGFLVSDSVGPILVCLVKTVVPADPPGADDAISGDRGATPGDRHVPASPAEPARRGGRAGMKTIDFGRIDEYLSEAARQFLALGAARPDRDGLPLLVVLFVDAHSDYFGRHPRRMYSFPQVSGIARLADDHAGGTAAGRFIVVRNECAGIPLPARFLAACQSYGE